MKNVKEIENILLGTEFNNKLFKPFGLQSDLNKINMYWMMDV
jgi:hypothetical protein